MNEWGTMGNADHFKKECSVAVKHIFTYDKNGQANMLTNPSDELNRIIQLMSGLLLMSPVSSGKTSVVERGYEDWIIKNTGNFYIVCVVDHCEKSKVDELMRLVENNLNSKENDLRPINEMLISSPKVNKILKSDEVEPADIILPPATPKKAKEALQAAFVNANPQSTFSWGERFLSLFTPKKTPLTENNEQKTPATILLTPMTKGSTGQRPKLPEDYVATVLFSDQEDAQKTSPSITATM